MTMFLIQSAILLAIAFLIGCIIGCVLRGLMRRETSSAPLATIVQTAPVAAAAAPVIAPALPVAAAEVVPQGAVQKPRIRAVGAPVSKPLVAKPDDLKLIVGIGPVNERKLHALDIRRFAQIAGWSAKDEASYGQKLEFPGRIEREEWVRQAKLLAAGGKSEDRGELARGAGQSSKAQAVSSTKASARTSSPKSTAGKAARVDGKSIQVKAAAAKKPIALKLDKAVGGKPDNLTLIDGIGNVIEKKLNEMGVFHFEQISNWTMVQGEAFSKAVGFPGRALREGWVKEAAIFAKGGTTDHAKKVEAGKITTSRISKAAEKPINKK